MTTEYDFACRCGAPLRIVDLYGTSSTLRCSKCEHYSLGISNGEFRQAVFLTDFHVKRGDDARQRPLHDLEMARELVRSLLDDVRPSPASVTAFAIESDRHYGALQHAVRCGCSAFDLDRVMGDTRAITELVHSSAPGLPYGPVEFRPPSDGLVALASNGR